ncbi:MAG: acyl-CoA synthetase [Hyphomicrobiaceae bacterium]
MHLDLTSTYDHAVASFDWRLPARLNIAAAISDAHARARPELPALVYEQADGVVRTWTHGEINRAANRFANGLAALGVGAGDRVGVHLPQSPECLIAHVAALKLGAIVLPLFRLFGPEALAYRLADSGAKVLITLQSEWERCAPDLAPIPTLDLVLTIGARPNSNEPGIRSFDALLAAGSDRFETRDTAADDPALMIYTSGTTGQPKGVLHAHRVLFGHLPGVCLPQDRFPQPGDRFWTPADWAWIGGLLDVLWPSLYFGVPVVGSARGKFDPEWAFDFMARHGVRNVFMPPTALRLMRQVQNPRARFGHRLRSLGSGGETLGADLIAWGREALGVTMNEFYGQTECNLVVGNCASLFEVEPGSMGRAIPGHRLAVINADGHPVPDGAPGIVAVKRPDPVMFLRYWNRPEATAEKFRGDWLLLGDIARRDDRGYFWFEGRDDDIINSAGYRIGPGEVESCLEKHPAVAIAGVVGAPDVVRGEAVTAFVVLADGFQPDDVLATDIQAFVRDRLAAHEYPRAVHFLDHMPTTVTGKIMRKNLRAMVATGTRPDAS